MTVLLALSLVTACHESPPPSAVTAPAAERGERTIDHVDTAQRTEGDVESGDGGAKLLVPKGEQRACSPESRQAQACTMIYAPVCAVVDTGIRCIRAPCPSTKLVKFSNACVACKDRSTIGYYAGECVTPAR